MDDRAVYMDDFKTLRSIDMVPEAGFEPACLSATDFESVASTGSATRAYRRYRVNRRLSIIQVN